MIKLSEIKGERVLDVLADLVEPINNIATDKAAAELFGQREIPEGMSINEYVVKRVTAGIPALLKAHKKDVIKILALLSGSTAKEYAANMTIDSVIVDLSTLISDPLFNAFFTTAPSTRKLSGSASGNTEV